MPGNKKSILRSMDLNLLVALHALLDERHISRAAQVAGLSQPAMSRALQRLREEFGDPLLVKGKNGYELTPRAEALYPSLRQLISDLEGIYSAPTFDPATVRGEFRIAALDYEFIVLLPLLTERLRVVAPGITVKAFPFSNDDFGPLIRGDVDLVLTAVEEAPRNVYRQQLFDEVNVCLVNTRFLESHPEMSLDNFSELDHIWVYLRSPDPGKIDETLSEHGVSRKIVNTTPTFFLSAYTVASSTNLITVLPSRVGVNLKNHLPISNIDFPISFQSFKIYQVWHERHQKEPLHVFMRRLIADICKNI
jgi:DNA-binding transcriptional LysR family regulator